MVTVCVVVIAIAYALCVLSNAAQKSNDGAI
jgi:hypothetical protein